MAVAGTTLEELLSVRPLLLTVVKLSGFTRPAHPVTLKVAQVRQPSASTGFLEIDQMDFDDHAARVEFRAAGSRP